MFLPFSDSSIGVEADIKMTVWRFNMLKIDKASVDAMSMDALVPKLREREVVKTTAHLVRILSRAESSTVLPTPVFMDPRPCEICVINPRIFLAAIMIGYKPDQCVDPMDGDLQLAVLRSANELLVALPLILSNLVVSSSITPGSFLSVANKFVADFKAWKIVDEARLTTKITRALIAMYDCNIELAPDDENGIRLLAAMKEQVRRLRGKFVQLHNAQELANFDRTLDSMGYTIHRMLSA